MSATMTKEKSSENPNNRHTGGLSNLMLVAPGKGFEPLRARSPPANLPFSPLLLDLEAGAITTPPPRLEYNDCVCGVKTFPALKVIAVAKVSRDLTAKY